MSDVKLLNLDELAVIKRVVMFKGVEYEVAEQTVGQMAERLQLDKQLDLNKPEDFVEMLRRTAKNILPGASDEVVASMTAEQITKLIQFINDQDIQESAEQVQAELSKTQASDQESEKKS